MNDTWNGVIRYFFCLSSVLFKYRLDPFLLTIDVPPSDFTFECDVPLRETITHHIQKVIPRNKRFVILFFFFKRGWKENIIMSLVEGW